MLEQLRKAETDDPMVRPRLAGRVLHDLACKSAVSNEIIKPENLFAALASNGGFSCLMAAQFETAASGAADALTIVETNDGNLYYFGDLPNRYLIESRLSLLSLALGAAQSDGANISLDIVYQAMRHVAQTIGSEDFGVPQLPALSKPDHLPIDYLQPLWSVFQEALQQYEVPTEYWPASFGFALQDVFAAYKARIDPSTAAQICIEYAVPMAKVDPRRIAGAFG